MYQSMYKVLLLSLSATSVLSDFLGPTFPCPRDIAGDNSLVYHAWNNVTSTLNAYLDSPTIDLTGPSGLKNLTFSVGVSRLGILTPSSIWPFDYLEGSEELGNRQQIAVQKQVMLTVETHRCSHCTTNVLPGICNSITRPQKSPIQPQVRRKQTPIVSTELPV